MYLLIGILKMQKSMLFIIRGRLVSKFEVKIIHITAFLNVVKTDLMITIYIHFYQRLVN